MRLVLVCLVLGPACVLAGFTNNQFIQSDRASRLNATGSLVYLRLNEADDTIILCLTRKDSLLTVDTCSPAQSPAQGWYALQCACV